MKFFLTISLAALLAALAASLERCSNNDEIMLEPRMLNPNESISFVTPYTGSDAVTCPETPILSSYNVVYASQTMVSASDQTTTSDEGEATSVNQGSASDVFQTLNDRAIAPHGAIGASHAGSNMGNTAEDSLDSPTFVNLTDLLLKVRSPSTGLQARFTTLVLATAATDADISGSGAIPVMEATFTLFEGEPLRTEHAHKQSASCSVVTEKPENLMQREPAIAAETFADDTDGDHPLTSSYSSVHSHPSAQLATACSENGNDSCPQPPLVYIPAHDNLRTAALPVNSSVVSIYTRNGTTLVTANPVNVTVTVMTLAIGNSLNYTATVTFTNTDKITASTFTPGNNALSVFSAAEANYSNHTAISKLRSATTNKTTTQTLGHDAPSVFSAASASYYNSTTIANITRRTSPILTPTLDPTRQQNTTSHWRGFNVVNQAPLDPSRFKTTDEWSLAFNHIRNLMPNANAIRLYSTTDGTTRHLANAIPAARNQGLKILVGVWSGGDLHQDRFALEKTALDDALAQFGCDDLIAVSVGNEDMYSRHRTDGNQTPLSDIMLLVNQTREITGVLDKHNCRSVKITHTDTFNDWLTTNFSEPLIRQVDFLIVNIFPYWEGQPIKTAGQLFWQHVNETRDMAARYGKEIWIGETGWPMLGDQVGKAEASAENMNLYWTQVGCDLMGNLSAFWYVEWDANATPSFGLMDHDGRSLIGDLACPI